MTGALAAIVVDSYTEIALALRHRGWCIRPGFIGADLVRALAEEARQLRAEGEFRRAGVGRGPSFQVRPEVRGDYVHWLEPDTTTPAQALYLAELEALRLAINRELFLGLYEFEGHLAIYPPGSFYARHLDQFEGVRYRLVTCVLYLNSAWHNEDGGQLRLYLKDPAGGEIQQDVQPQGGTLACFLSGEFEHEVLPATRERASITGWFRSLF